MTISTERLAERGYNQMLIIANLLSKKLNIPVWQPVIRLAQHSQKGLSRVERMENIAEQFQVIKAERRKYRKVLIIDDVVTTGSSIRALSNALEKLGCQQIEMACIAAAQICAIKNEPYGSILFINQTINSHWYSASVM